MCKDLSISHPIQPALKEIARGATLVLAPRLKNRQGLSSGCLPVKRLMVLVLLNLTATGLDIWGLDDMMLQDNSEVEMKYPTLCERFFSTPGLYLQGVLAFRGGIVTEGTLTDRQLMNSALKSIIISILRDTKFSVDNQVTGEKDSKSALGKAFNPSVHAAASSGLS